MRLANVVKRRGGHIRGASLLAGKNGRSHGVRIANKGTDNGKGNRVGMK